MADEERRRRCESLLREHRRIVFKVAAVYARNAEDRQDLAQDIALQVWRSFASYDPARPFTTWMYRVALNVGLSHARRERERPPMEGADALDALEGGMPIVEPDERLAHLARAIEALEPLERALALLYLDELPYTEIAGVLGLSETNVGTRIARLKQRLRRQLIGTPTP
ncbi:sigma-70 family RNA polymerase sigma factor [Luteibacter pinisoli]|uniref:Sigma-70 family RNA polymerase sigma factor n=1 Tax=Luteibacter pinisoli TaxID=2589080 RepID=A0A4Y5Z085_9GAMM|nr:sigma-70 family RNA polymerase sigma factor [Luteibacter pinisoli]QDE38682.1 sigma-70 family RNA polymerase sigma factor [Luteibacter pinisoli]